MSRLAIAPQILAEIRRRALYAYPDECCGILIGMYDDGVACVEDIRPVRNPLHGKEWDIPHSVVMSVKHELMVRNHLHDTAMALLGFYHSHPRRSTQPSDADRQHALPGYFYLIVTCHRETTGAVNAWYALRGRLEHSTLEVIA